MELTGNIRSYVGEVAMLCRTLFPDQGFGRLDNRHSITIDGIDLLARYVRFLVRGPVCLHLRHCEILAGPPGKSRNVAPQASVKTSSVWPGSEHLGVNAFTRPNKARYSFHTKSDEPAWVIVDLGKVEQIQTIVIHNRMDQFAERAWGLRVAVSESDSFDDGDEVYAHPAVRKAIDAMLLRHRKHYPDQALAYAMRETIDDCLVHLLYGEYVKANQRLRHQSGFPHAVKNAVASAFNAEFMDKLKLEWTNHGLKRTFRYWSETEKQNYLAFATGIVEHLNAMGFDAAIGYGAVLSYLRDQSLIPHDDDLDILVSAPRGQYGVLAHFIDDICPRMEQLGYRVHGDFVSHRHLSKDGFTADIFFGFAEGSFVSFFPGPRHMLRHEDVFPAAMLPLHSVDCPFPANPARYVETVYGQSWREPIPGWNHTWNRTEYTDWFDPPAATG